MFAERWSELLMVILSVRELQKPSIAGTEKEKRIAKGQWVSQCTEWAQHRINAEIEYN